MRNTVKAYVSYSRVTEEKTNIIHELAKYSRARGIELILDKNVVKHGDRIKLFMDSLAQATHIITVFSQPYFKSKWCMYELLQTYYRGEFHKRTHHIITEDCDLQDTDYRIELVDYWNEKYKAAAAKLKDRNPQLIPDEFLDLEIYQDISQKVNKLVNFAKDRLITPLKDLRAQEYSQILDLIKLPSNLSTEIDPIGDFDIKEYYSRFANDEEHFKVVLNIRNKVFGDKPVVPDTVYETCWKKNKFAMKIIYDLHYGSILGTIGYWSVIPVLEPFFFDFIEGKITIKGKTPHETLLTDGCLSWENIDIDNIYLYIVGIVVPIPDDHASAREIRATRVYLDALSFIKELKNMGLNIKGICGYPSTEKGRKFLKKRTGMEELNIFIDGNPEQPIYYANATHFSKIVSETIENELTGCKRYIPIWDKDQKAQFFAQFK